MLYQYAGASDSKKKNFAICSKTFEFEDDAIDLYLVEADQMIAKDVRKGRCILLRPGKAPILN